MTDAEQKLWFRLRQRQLGGVRFRRQVPLGPYIADFLSCEAKVVIEVDGGQHYMPESTDPTRDRWMMSEGYRVLRFSNLEVLNHIEVVVQTIIDHLEE